MLKKLEDVKTKHYLVEKNDSILSIVMLGDEERVLRINQIIENLKEKEEKETQLKAKTRKKKKRKKKKKSMYFSGDAFSSFDDGKRNFYFYSKNTLEKGRSDFKKIWGNRNLIDNWRLIEKTTRLQTTTKEIDKKESTTLEKDVLMGKTEEKNPRRFDVSFYLESLPEVGSFEQANLKLARDSAQLALGQLYYDRFNNHRLAFSTLKRLIATPPALIPIEREAYFTLFRISEQEKLGGSDTIRQHILDKYQDWSKAYFLKNKKANAYSFSSEASLALYQKAYSAYELKKYDEVFNLFRIAQKDYFSQKIIEKFYVLNAFSINKTKGREAFEVALDEIKLQFAPNSDAYKRANELLKEIKLLDWEKPKSNEDDDVIEVVKDKKKDSKEDKDVDENEGRNEEEEEGEQYSPFGRIVN